MGFSIGKTMASYNYLYIHQCEDIEFDDLIALHQDLNVGELMEGDAGINPGTFIDHEKGHVVLYDRDEGSYASSTLVWSCWGQNQYDAIAKHLISGKLVLRYAPEFGPDVYYVITPNDVEKVELKF